MNRQYFKRLALLPFLAFADNAYADEKASPLSGTSITTNIVYGQAINQQGDQQDLTLDLYAPTSNQQQNPLIVFIHGGSFVQGRKEDVAAYCQFFAEKGFIAVTINYRLGWNTGTTGNVCDGDPVSLKKAGYRAIQDARAALRFLVAHASQYKIDPARIFLAGESAGGTTALAAAYMDQVECDAFLPNVSQSLGLIDNSGNNLTTTFSIRGIINMWGGVLDLSVIDPTEKIPVLSFHGTADKVTPYEAGPFNECASFMQVYGSKPIYDVLLSRNVSTVLHANINGGHGVYTFDYRANNILCFVSRLQRSEMVSGFYNDFTDMCKPVSLPVRFNAFTLSKEHGTVLLNWQTVEEQNSLCYQVERSNNGRSFTAIASLPTKEGPDVNTYSYRDKAPLEGKSYYRLRQVDKNGAFMFSPVRAVWWMPQHQLHVVNHGNTATINCYDFSGQPYSVIDANGHLIKKGRLTKSKTTITGLRAGSYVLLVLINNTPFQKQFIILE